MSLEYVNVNDFLAYLGPKPDAGRESPSADVVERLLEAAEDAVARFTNRKFKRASYVEYRDGSSRRDLVLRHYPVVGTPTVLEGTTALTVSADPTTNPHVVLLRETGILRRPWGYWVPVPFGYKITYDAGYDTVPAVVVQAAYDMAALFWRERDHIGIESKNVGEQQTTYRRELPDEVKAALRTYRRHSLGYAV